MYIGILPLVDTIGGGQTEWVITFSDTWTVPKTGRYMLELYGSGGGSSTSVAGSGAGNYGAAGKRVNRNENGHNYGTGKLSTTYGFGASTATITGGDGAVYLKYLCA